jgi:hypothetical protein
MGGSSLRDRADDLLERASVLSESSSGGRPHSSPALGSTRRRRKPRWSTPGPGAYNIDDSKKAASLGGMGRHGKGGAAYSFGTAARYDDRAKQYLGAGHGSASSMFGHQSPGATTACSLRSLPPSLPPSRPAMLFGRSAWSAPVLSGKCVRRSRTNHEWPTRRGVPQVNFNPDPSLYHKEDIGPKGGAWNDIVNLAGLMPVRGNAVLLLLLPFLTSPHA